MVIIVLKTMDKELKNSEDFIRSHATGEGFSTPENYFDSVEDIFSSKLKEASLPQVHGFNAPDSYFENLEDTILAKAAPKTAKVISLRKRFVKIIPAAAAAAIALLIVFNIPKQIEEPTVEEIANWFENDINRISSDDISLAFEDLDIDDDIVDTSFNLDEIETYLEQVDTSSLLNEIN